MSDSRTLGTRHVSRLRWYGVSVLGLLACAKNQVPAAPEPIVVQAPEPESNPVLAEKLPESEPTSDQGTPAEQLLALFGEHRCDSYDYHPNGGLQSLWCHRAPALEFADLGALARVPVFLSGPHTTDTLDLNSPNSFGHYNPAFVQFLIDHTVSERGSVAQRATQPAYDRHLKPLAQIFWLTLGKIKAEPACFEREKKAYQRAIQRKAAGYYERWFYFMNPAFCGKVQRTERYLMDHGFDGGVDGNVTKTVVGFWLRRSMDGTFDAFATGLQKLVRAYDPELSEGARP